MVENTKKLESLIIIGVRTDWNCNINWGSNMDRVVSNAADKSSDPNTVHLPISRVAIILFEPLGWQSQWNVVFCMPIGMGHIIRFRVYDLQVCLQQVSPVFLIGSVY